MSGSTQFKHLLFNAPQYTKVNVFPIYQQWTTGIGILKFFKMPFQQHQEHEILDINLPNMYSIYMQKTTKL